MRARILIVEDHPLVRRGIRRYLEHRTVFSICGEAENGNVAIEQAKALEPDLIVMDLALPMLNGVEASAIVKGILPAVKVVAFSMYADQLERAVTGGSDIDAALPKSSGLALLAETIRRLLTALG